MTADDMLSPESNGNPVVFIENGHVRATSRDVAAYFGKRHADVVRAVRALLAAERGLGQRTFALAEYTDDQGKSRQVFNMDRDGFTLLAMGFTGPNALRFKLAYIDAFNRMEVSLAVTTAGDSESSCPNHHEFPDWPLDEMRVKKAVADMYRMAYGPLSAQWIMPQLGFPTPPRTMIELGRQLLLNLVGGESAPEREDCREAA